MNLQLGQVFLLRMQYHQRGGSKIRPAVVLLDANDEDFVAAPVTSQARQSDLDLAISDWRAAKLNKPSTIRLHKLTVLSKYDIVHKLGSLSDHDCQALSVLLCRMFCAR